MFSTAEGMYIIRKAEGHRPDSHCVFKILEGQICEHMVIEADNGCAYLERQRPGDEEERVSEKTKNQI